MPPKRLKKKFVKRLVEKRVAKGIEKYEKTKTSSDKAESSGGNTENVGGTGSVQGNITSSKTTTLHEAINMARELVEQEVQVKAARNRRQETARAHVAAPADGHLENDCRARLPGAGVTPLQDVTCYGCGEKGHYKNKCPKGRNQLKKEARARAYVIGTENPQQNPNVATGTFLLNDHYASVLFDSGAERSFISIEFTPFIDIASAALNTSYEVELADGKVVSANTILRGCTLALFNHVLIRIVKPI
ncbi:putative reverse transcriptase domain-containing protein [Tanacetum coccineum]